MGAKHTLRGDTPSYDIWECIRLGDNGLLKQCKICSGGMGYNGMSE